MAEAVRADAAHNARADGAHPARPSDDADRKSVFKLIGELPNLVTTLIRDEIDALKTELVTKLKNAGIGIGFFAGAAVLAYFAGLALLATVILLIALLLPYWLSALIVGVVLLIGAGILALIGLRRIKRGPAVPADTIESVKTDVKAVKGVGSYDR